VSINDKISMNELAPYDDRSYKVPFRGFRGGTCWQSWRSATSNPVEVGFQNNNLNEMTENNPINANYPLSELTEKIIKCAQAVHKQIGNGFHEMVYRRPLAFELFIRDIPFEREMDILLNYNQVKAGKISADFFVDGKVLVELESTMQLDGAPLNPIRNLLEAHNLEVGMILNFGDEQLEYRIITNTKYQKANSRLEKERV